MTNTDAEFRLDYLSDCIEPEQFRPDPVLLFCMNGDLSVTVEGERLTLPANGVLLINPNRRFSLSAGKQSLACRLTIPAAVLKRYLAGRAPLFWCNSLQDSREEYDRWRHYYPEYDTTQRWAKVPSQELSDMLVDALKEDDNKK